MSTDIEIKLSAARTRLILDKPFLGALVLRLPMIAADPGWCKTTATDARSFYYNAEFIDSLSVDQTQFILAHEALHCALSHFARRMSRDKHRWDLACDLAINPLLIAEGLKPTPNALYLELYEGMTAEEIYPCLDESEHMEPEDHHVYDKENQGEGGQRGRGGENQDQTEKGQGKHRPEEKQGEAEEGKEGEADTQEQGGTGGAKQPPPLSREEQDSLSIQWQQRMAGAAQQAMQAGKISGPLKRMIEHLLQPRLPWRLLLARYMTASAREDYNYSRPSRREGEFILPSLRSNSIEVVVALDTSGSIEDKEMSEFLAEINALKGQASARITLLACDCELNDEGPWVYEPWEEFKLPKAFAGGGSTDFRPVFEWVEKEGKRPDLVVYFTDAAGDFPEIEPNFPVIWLIKGKGTVPWGQRIQLN